MAQTLHCSLKLLGAATWLSADGRRHELPDKLPGWLLAYLACRGDWVPRDALAALLWPDRLPAEGLNNLRANLHRVRELLLQWGGAAALHAEPNRVRVQLPTDVAAIQAALARGDWAEASGFDGDALLSSLSFRGFAPLEEWAGEERRTLAAAWRSAVSKAARAAAGSAPQHAAALLLRLLRSELGNESALQELMRLAPAAGCRDEALAEYERCCRWLRDELGATADPLTVELAESLRRSTAAAPMPAPDAAQAPAQTPTQPPSWSDAADDGAFVGRRTELDAAQRLLHQDGCRQLTLLGPGGVGKSSLARRLLAQEGQHFGGAAVWVELQDLDSVAAVLTRLAARLDLALDDGQALLPQIARRLRGERALLVLDNAEHLAELPAAVQRLLDEVPTLTIVLTSRVRSHCPHEQVLPLAGLPVPDEDSRDLEAAAHFDAVRLFALRARAARRGFDLARELPAVIRIVEAVGGLPLAIELAASWVRLLPAAEIAHELGRAIEVLQRDPAAPVAPARQEHASMRAVLERSWQLLAPAERDALGALAVFHGGFGLAAAQAVAGVQLPLLSSLVDKSMLAIDESGRMAAHPLLLAFVLERSPEPSQTLRLRHATHFAGVLRELAPHARADPRALLQGVEAGFSNIVAAWRTAVQARRAELLGDMALPLGAYFEHRGRLGDGAALLREALALPAVDAAAQRALARVRSAVAGLLHRRRDLDEALAIAQAGIRLAELAGDAPALIGCLSHAGSCLSVLGRWREARPCFERALALAQEQGDRAGIASSLLNLGVCAKKDGQLDEAIALYTRSLEQERELGHHAAIGRCLNNIGVLHMEREDWAQARDVMAEGVTLCDRHQLRSLAPYLTNGLGLALYELGELEPAQQCFLRAIELARATETRVVEQTASCLAARVAARRGRFDEARMRFRQALLGAGAMHSIPDQLDVAMYHAELQRETGDRVGAWRTWQMVASHPRAEAGVRGSCQKWRDALALDDAEMRDATREPLSLEEFVAALTR